jgi:hypothetical protein
MPPTRSKKNDANRSHLEEVAQLHRLRRPLTLGDIDEDVYRAGETMFTLATRRVPSSKSDDRFFWALIQHLRHDYRGAVDGERTKQNGRRS